MKSLYVSRRLLNGSAIRIWAKEQGFTSTLPASDMHVTILYSKRPMAWTDVDLDKNDLTVEGGEREAKRLGDGGEAVVLKFSSDALSERHQTFMDAGGSSDYDTYQSHITITYRGDGLDLEDVEPYTGELVFGPEVYREIRPNWEDDAKPEITVTIRPA